MNCTQDEIHNKLAWALRFLSIDMVEAAKSGHPGMPMGFADVATVLFGKFLKFNPLNPTWAARDRFILSAGHGSALLYSLLYLTGYKGYEIDDLQKFRQFNSKTPGHPELDLDLGIETTTGPLGQGLANAVGIALFAKIMAAKLGLKHLFNVYVVVGDGCLMEGISHEALSLAGHLKLDNLIVLFDDNEISIDGNTNLSCSDIIIDRLLSYNFDALAVNGHNTKVINDSIITAQKSNKPAFIAFKTKIGFGSPTFENTHLAHGKNLGTEEIKIIKESFGSSQEAFYIEPAILKIWRSFYQKNVTSYSNWNKNHQNNYKALLTNDVSKDIANIEKLKKKYFSLKHSEATRKSSQKVIETILDSPLIIGGSADLSESNCTISNKHKIISKNSYNGNYLHYGVREHSMVAIMNGMSICGLRPYAGSFLVFSDYCRPAIRLAALMKQPINMIFTHDGIGVGEDGPTHQPIEHLSSLRAIPNLNVFRPADAIETCECWQLILQSRSRPSVLCLTRQGVHSVRTKYNESNAVSLGAYIIYQEVAKKMVTIFASGSEVAIAIAVAKILAKKDIGAVIVSVPCQELFWQQPSDYQASLLCDSSLKIAIEAGIEQSWLKIIGPKGVFFGVNAFGTSAPAKELYQYFNITKEKISKKIFSLVQPT